MRIALYADSPSLDLPQVRGAPRGNAGGPEVSGRDDPNGRRCLFVGGKSGERANYMMFVGSNQHDNGYHPRHRHAVDQVRVVISGEVDFGDGVKLKAGDVGYFPAGTHYGPYDGSVYIGPDIMLCQFESIHPTTYIPVNSPELKAAFRTLGEKGSFKDGIYSWVDEAGKKHNKDGYEAAVEHVTGRPLTYPRPLYRRPVIVTPSNFPRREVVPGVAVRDLGTYSGNAVRMATLEIAAGQSFEVAAFPDQRVTMLTVTKGSGVCNGTTLGVRDAIALDPGDSASITTKDGIEVFAFGMPVLAEDAALAA